MIDFNEIDNINLKSNNAFTIKTLENKFYTIYTKKTLIDNIKNGNIDINNDLLYIRRIS